MQEYQSLVENADQIDLSDVEAFAAIIGETPSQGARSPILWNSAFAGMQLPCKMVPFDVKKENLKPLVDKLQRDQRFLGGAITMPYKVDLVPLVPELEPEAEIIGAINCIYRKNDSLVGSNTDGAGALVSLEENLRKRSKRLSSGQSVLLLGTGGAGAAVATYVAKSLGKSGTLVLANRTTAKAKDLAEKLAGYTEVECVSMPVKTNKQFDVIINCTSIGFGPFRLLDGKKYSYRPFTPLGSIPEPILLQSDEATENILACKAKNEIAQNIEETIDFLSEQKNSFVFDIIYQPLNTLLLSMADICGHIHMNGSAMNLEQAVIAFEKACSSTYATLNADEVRSFMERTR